MGVQIIFCDLYWVIVIGLGWKNQFWGIEMFLLDICVGVVLLIVAFLVKGKSVIYNIYQIDWGYEQIDVWLRVLGVWIEWVEG